MTQNSKSGLQIAALTGFLLLIAVIVTASNHNAKQQQAMHLSIGNSLKNCSESLFKENQLLTQNQVREYFSNEGIRHLPSFVVPTDIFYPLNSVKWEGHELLCVIRHGQNLHTLCDNGNCFIMSQAQFENLAKISPK